MTLRISELAARVPASGIREISELAHSVEGTIHLELGEPDFPTPTHIVEAAHQAALEGYTKYAPSAGFGRLRDEIVRKVATTNGFSIDPGQVTITNGATEGLYSVFLALLQPGDEVLYPDPGWPNAKMMIELTGATVVGYPLTKENSFVPDPQQVRDLITSRTRLLVINSPSNPLGSVTSAEIMEQLLAAAAEHDLWVISDECYEAMVFGGKATSLATLDGDDRVITAFSFSKTYAMTGWRVGYIVSPKKLASTIVKMQQAVIGSVNAPAQMAAIAALEGQQAIVGDMRDEYESRRNAAISALSAGSASALQPDGGFYVWIDVRSSGHATLDFAKALIMEKKVAVVPGSAFGPQGEGFVRMSLVAAPDLVSTGAARLSEFCLELSRTASSSL